MTAIPVRYRRAQRGQFIQQLQHAVPSVVILGDGLNHVQHGAEGARLALGLAEILISVLVIGSVLRRFRQLRAGAVAAGHPAVAHAIDWVDLFLGAMLLVEAAAEYQTSGHLRRPTLVLGVMLIGVGLAHGRIAAWGARRRELRVDEAGLSVPGRFFRRLTLAWAEVAEITVGPAKARVIALDGRDQELDLADADQADAIRELLADARARLERYRIAQTGRSTITNE